jgi:uncharacterized protein
MPVDPPQVLLRRFLQSMLIAASGGILFNAAGFPAAWLAGGMVFSGTAALMGQRVFVPLLVARLFYLTLGISIGGVVSPQTLGGILSWPASIVLVCLAMWVVTFATKNYLQAVHHFDPQTALFAGVPGALSQVMVLATERDVDIRAIAIVQTIRVVILAVCVPLGLGLFGFASPTRMPAWPLSIFEAPLEFAVLVLGSIGAAFALMRVGFPGGQLFGPMLVSAALHGANVVHVGLPVWFTNTAMIGIGAVVGSRFVGMSGRLLVSYLGAALGCFAVSIAISAAFALAAASLVSTHGPDLIVAYAPGSVDAMMILALAMHLDPVFVGAHHLVRLFIVNVSLPFLLRWTTADSGK